MTRVSISGFPLPLDRAFTSAEAYAAGVSAREIRSMLLGAQIRQQVRGVYVGAGTPDTPLLRAQSLRLVVPEGYVVVDESAGWLAGASMMLRPGAHLTPPPVSVFAISAGQRLRNKLADSGERSLLPRDVMEIGGVLATTPLRTFNDLARLRPADFGIGGLDQLLALRSFTLDQALGEVERYKGMRGVVQSRWLVPHADPRSEPPPEATLRLRMCLAGMPEVVPQQDVVVDDRFVGRADLMIRELKLVVEYFGEDFHTPEQAASDAARAEAMAGAGWIVLILRRHNVFGRRRNDDELAWSAIAEARRTPGRRVGRVIVG